jgi:uncharacterized membrane protein YphA (DoxX/SURF4 family)
MRFESGLNNAWWVLRIGLGLGPILAGLDKYFNLLTNWEMYLNPLVPRLLHVQDVTFMHIVGVVEIVAGILVLSRLTRYAAYIVMLWLLGIALNLASQGHFFDIAVRDVEISLGAFALAKLSEARAYAMQKEPAVPQAAKSNARAVA